MNVFNPFTIPKEDLVHAFTRAEGLVKYTIDYLSTDDLEYIRFFLPEQFRAIPLIELRRQVINLRKQGLIKCS